MYAVEAVFQPLVQTGMATVPQPSEFLARALELFRDAMKPVALHMLERVWGSQWHVEVGRRMTFTEYNPLDLSDVKTLLNVMDFCWRDVFARPYGPDARAGFNKVKNLELVRNRWAHFRGLTINESYRAVDDMLQLMVAFGAEEREDLEALRDELLFRLVEERSARMEDRASASASRRRPEAAGTRTKEALPEGFLLADRFRVERVLGRPGGFGITYLASDVQLERSVAIKEFFPPFVSRGTDGIQVVPERPERFERGCGAFLEEARALAAIDHPAIMPVWSFFEENGTAYIEMPFRAARSLEEELDVGGPLAPDEAVALMLQLLHGLQAVHNAGLLHLDIKPSNILVDEEGRPILIDFGASRRRDPDQGRTVVVSPGYAAPEQYIGEPLGEWTDVYACGATLYAMLTGQTPPAAPVRQAGAVLDRADRVDPVIPPRVARAAESALALDRRSRPPGARALAARLRAQDVPSRPGRRRLLGGAAGLVGSLLVALGLVHLWGTSREGASTPPGPEAVGTHPGPEAGGLHPDQGFADTHSGAGAAGTRTGTEAGTPLPGIHGVQIPPEIESLAEAGVDPDAAASPMPATPRLTAGEALERGRRAVQAGQYEEAVAWFLRADSLGSPHAAYNLGIVFSRNLQRTDEAERWYRKAADAGDAEAQVLLGFLYESEPERGGNAEGWYARAAEQGNDVARVNLARLYAGQNRCEEAYHLASLASAGGAPEATYLMGVLVESGCGVAADPDLAADWFEQAAAQGHERAFRALVRLGRWE